MTLLHFPADRRAADVRRCAAALQDLHGETANQFWRTEMARFANELKAQGMGAMEISRQAGLFMHAVQMELQSAYTEAMDAFA